MYSHFHCFLQKCNLVMSDECPSLLSCLLQLTWFIYRLILETSVSLKNTRVLYSPATPLCPACLTEGNVRQICCISVVYSKCMWGKPSPGSVFVSFRVLTSIYNDLYPQTFISTNGFNAQLFVYEATEGWGVYRSIIKANFGVDLNIPMIESQFFCTALHNVLCRRCSFEFMLYFCCPLTSSIRDKQVHTLYTEHIVVQFNTQLLLTCWN